MEKDKKETQKVNLGLYIHIPFCVKKCDYCDFLSAPADENTKREYVHALIAEIKSYKDLASEYQVRTIFIGGGTPSSISGEYITKIMNAIKDVFIVGALTDKKRHLKIEEDFKAGRIEAERAELPEITIEINPGTLTMEKLRYYKAAGINRLSFGLQSADNEELKLLGRIHTYEEFAANYKLAREAGFDNINIDLMSALPGQTLNHWLCTLDKVINLKPEHISAYSLIIEEGTPFFLRYNEEDQDEELDREIYAKTKEYLNSSGYYRYEISNYAKPGYECRHNSSYWRRTDYLGIGLGASSLLHNVRFHNVDNLDEYMKLSSDYHNIRRNIENLDHGEQMEEFMFLGLRMSNGVNKDEFKKQFGQNIETIYGDVINQSISEGLLIMEENQIYLSDRGVDLSNTVMARFLFDKNII
jgi:oxygen-independent coproporphyrinogen-3 oxidase